MKKFEYIFKWMLVIFTLYIIYEVIRKILGGSLGFEELTVSLLIANLGYSFYLTFYIARAVHKSDSKLSGHINWHRGRDSIK